MKVFYSSGLLYTYLAGHVGRDSSEGAFRALTRGYMRWASGRLEDIQVNTNNPEYCRIQCSMKPSMRAGVYRVYILLGCEGSLAKNCSATCQCAAGYVSPLPPFLPHLLLSLSLSLSCCMLFFPYRNQPAVLMFLLFFMLSVPLLLLPFKYDLIILLLT